MARQTWGNRPAAGHAAEFNDAVKQIGRTPVTIRKPYCFKLSANCELRRQRVVVGEMIVVKGPVVSISELRSQIAKCRRLARMTDAETARRLLQLASEYEARLDPQQPVTP